MTKMKAWGWIIAALIICGAGGAAFVLAPPATPLDSDTTTQKQYGIFNSLQWLNGTAGRVPYLGAGGTVADDAGLTYDSATNTVTVGNLTVSGKNWTESEADYVVWADGGTYYAKNGHTGQVTSNANLQTLISTSVSGGGTIFLKQGVGLGSTLAGISDASATNHYQVRVSGDITETATITPVSYVDVIGPAEVTVTSNAAIDGVAFGNIISSFWFGVTVHRAGVASGTRYAATFTSTPNTVRLDQCRFYNDLTGAGSCRGAIIQTSSSPILTDCLAVGGPGGTLCYGWYVADSNPTMLRCDGYAGDGGENARGWVINGAATGTYIGCRGFGGSSAGTFNVGWYITDTASGEFHNCYGLGGSGGTYCYGWYILLNATPTFHNCYGLGGSGGWKAYGWGVYDSANPKFYGGYGQGGPTGQYSRGIYFEGAAGGRLNEFTGIGGDGGEDAHGIYIGDTASPQLTACVGVPGGGGENNAGIYVGQASSATLTDCVGALNQVSKTFSYNSANNGRFQPYSGHPYQVVSLCIYVNTATPGATLDIGTSIGGSEVANNIDISAIGSVYADIVRVELTANSYLYATPSAVISNNSVKIWYTVTNNYEYNNAIYIQTIGYARIYGGSYTSNGASDACAIVDDACTTTNWILSGCSIETLDPANQESIIAEAACNPAPIYHCTLVGSTTNVTAAAGTAVGTNTQIAP
jgi:hypothetical protein